MGKDRVRVTQIVVCLLLATATLSPAQGTDIVSILSNLNVNVATNLDWRQRVALYREMTAQLNGIINQVTSADKIRAVLEPILYTRPWEQRDRDDWAQVRFKSAQIIVTNLALLETGDRMTSIVYNRATDPRRPRFLGDEDTVDRLTGSERAEYMEFREARNASVRLWNLHQGLAVEHGGGRGEWAIKWLAREYRYPPSAAEELRPLMEAYRGYEFPKQFSNQLFQARRGLIQ